MTNTFDNSLMKNMLPIENPFNLSRLENATDDNLSSVTSTIPPSVNHALLYDLEDSYTITHYSLDASNELVLDLLDNERNLISTLPRITNGSNERVVKELTEHIENVKFIRVGNTHERLGGSIRDLHIWGFPSNNNKILLLSSQNKVESLDVLNNKIVEITSQTEQDFINHGLTTLDLAQFDFSSDFTGKNYINNQSTLLGSGKVFEQPLDHIVKKVKVN